MFRKSLRFEALEDRRVLAITLNFNPTSGLLSIQSNSASDFVQVEGMGRPGALEIESNGTVLNRFEGVQRINASMGGGDDGLFFGAVFIGGSIVANMGSGKDVFDLDATTTSIGFSVDGPSFVGGSVTANMGGNAEDYVNVDAAGADGVTIGGNFTVNQAADVDFDGDGMSVLFQANDICIGGNLSIGLAMFTDVSMDGANLELRDVNVGGMTSIQGSSAGDLVRIFNSSFGRKLSVNLMAGNDTLDFGGLSDRNYFADRVTLYGGSGNDTLNENDFNVFVIPAIVTQFETFI